MSDLRSRVEQSLAGTYTLERELGGGGMSRVFVAHEDRLGRKVVVKLLSPDLAAAMSASRFEREIQVAASLQQANIVPVLATGDVDGLPYYTMPYVEGESLRARLARGPLAVGEAVSILRDVSRALAYAHDRGVVHRDIKPDNVLLSGHTAVVTDFGIAKAIAAAAEGPAGATLTQLGTAVGTPAYMAPEQAAGDPATDHRADVYAFGCMAYELLAGASPFAGLPPHKMLVAHMAETPAPLSERRPDCPPALASLVMQCLAKEPSLRPANATELLHRLDAVASPSGAGAAVPAILIGGRAMLWRALAIYAIAFVVVAIVARAAIIAIGLPDWVFPGSLVVMALGLPVILFTAYTQYVSHRAATATPTFTPGGSHAALPHGTMATLAIKASPHLSWRRTVRGGAIAFGAFALLVGGFMMLRALGIGPAGSLLAAGKLSASDKVLVAAFEAPAADSSLGVTLAEAVRTNLSQSRTVHVVPTSSVVAALEQMKRPDSTRVDLKTAREIAQRAGAKAVVAGSVVPAGNGYVVSVRLVSAESGDELASFRESVKDAGELIPSIDHLTKELRGKMGESLKAVRAAPRLDQVTTGSLAALRSYTAAMYANDVQGDYPAAVRGFHDAIAQDSTFAMAHVQLAYSLLTLGGPVRRAQANDELATAFRLRYRLPERERYNVEGAYYMNAGDRPRANVAFQRAIEVDSSNMDAENSLAVNLDGARDYAGAEKMYRLALGNDPGNVTLLGNLVNMYTEMGRHASFDSVMAVIEALKTPYPTAGMYYEEHWNRNDIDGVERLARAKADSGKPRAALNAQSTLVSVDMAHGRLREAEKRYAQVVQTQPVVTGDTVNPLYAAYMRATIEGELRGNIPGAAAILDAAMRANPPASVPVARDQSRWMVIAYARMGNAAKAREILDRYASRLDTLARRQQYVLFMRTRGWIALDEGHADSAIAYLRQGDREADGLPTGNCSACTPAFIGEAFARTGQRDSARVYLAQFVEMAGSGRSFIDRFMLAPTLFRLGELSEDAHDAKKAAEYYARFVDLWRTADPELQPRVAEARSRLAKLQRVTQ